MDFKSERTKQFRVINRGFALPLIETKQEQDALDSVQTIDLAMCPCGQVLHNPEEIKGTCRICGAPLGEECSGRVCVLADCGRKVCVDHGTSVQDKVICSNHTRWEIFSGRALNGSRQA